MKHLILVRHGDYNDWDIGLTNRGKVQITRLSKKLKELIKDSTACILSSTAKRASESALILADELGVGYTEHEVLWSEAGHPEDEAAALELVNQHSNDVDVLILVTHYEYVEYFPEYYGEHVLGVELESDVIPKGTAWLIDCEKKE